MNLSQSIQTVGANHKLSLPSNFVNQAIQQVQNGSYPVLKYRVSILLVLILMEEVEAIQKLLSVREYDKDFEHPDLNPLDLAVDIDNYLVLDTLGTYFEKHKIDVPVSRESFMKGLTCSSSIFKKVTMTSFLTEVSLPTSTVPIALKISPSLLPFYKVEHGISVSQQYLEDLEKKHKGPLTKFKYVRSAFKMPIDLGSTFIRDILNVMEKDPTIMETKEAQGFIKVLYKKNSVDIKINSIMFLTFSISMTVILVWCHGMDECEKFTQAGAFGFTIQLLLMIFGYMAYVFAAIIEFNLLFFKGIDHLKSIYNLLDVIIFVGAAPLIVLSIMNSQFNDNIHYNFATTMYVGILGFRSLLHLRMFDQIRYLIALILQVATDSIPFLIVLMISILYLSIMEIQLSKYTGGGFEGTFEELMKQIDLIYGIGYGNWEGNDTLPWNRYILFFFETLLFPLVMFNLLIAIISQTFTEVVEARDSIDQKEVLDILIDLSSVSIASNANYFCRKDKTYEYYLHLFLP